MVMQFGDGRNRVLIRSGLELAIDLAILNHGTAGRVCRLLGVSRDLLRRWKKGVRPREAHIEKLALLAGIPSEWISNQ
jgi:hypothetical protein